MVVGGKKKESSLSKKEVRGENYNFCFRNVDCEMPM